MNRQYRPNTGRVQVDAEDFETAEALKAELTKLHATPLSLEDLPSASAPVPAAATAAVAGGGGAPGPPPPPLPPAATASSSGDGAAAAASSAGGGGERGALLSAIAGGMTLRKTATQDSTAEHAATDGADLAGGTRSGGGSDASDPAQPPFDKRPPAGMDMCAEMAWRKKQKAAKAEAAAAPNDAGESGTLLRCPAEYCQ